MTKKPESKGTLLYPGVVLRGDHLILNPTSGAAKIQAKRKSRTICKTELKVRKKSDKRVWNLLIDD